MDASKSHFNWEAKMFVKMIPFFFNLSIGVEWMNKNIRNGIIRIFSLLVPIKRRFSFSSCLIFQNNWVKLIVRFH